MEEIKSMHQTVEPLMKMQEKTNQRSSKLDQRLESILKIQEDTLHKLFQDKGKGVSGERE